jgi:hypothetical protein
MSKTMAILIETDGEITTPSFPGLADVDHPDGGLRYVRDLIDSADPIAVEVPNSRLVVWLDGHAYSRMRSANTVASFAFADALDLPLQTVCGPLMVTGGFPEQPHPLTPLHVVKAMNRLGLALYPSAACWLLRNTFWPV